jgi:Fe(3+) dicitrate transport protein
LVINHGFYHSEMRSRVYSWLIFVLIGLPSLAQYSITGVVKNDQGQGVAGAEIYIKLTELLTATDKNGQFTISVKEKGRYELTVFSFEFQVLQQEVVVEGNTTLNLQLKELSSDLAEVVISEEREKVFQLKRLNPVEGTAIYAGKKSEVILVDNLIANKSSNNARQIYSQVVGLNIYESGDGGLQLSVGGRGLDPNRTSNFNTRQNGYDISADVLGYPESYYTPPVEALSQIQVVRGAASLQYGTQFGGLINFKMQRPSDQKLAVVSRQSIGSYNFYSSFNSLSGTAGKFSHYSYFHYKRGDSFRPNAGFESYNLFSNLRYKLSEKTSVSVELTYLTYLAQQAGGLTDQQFKEDPTFSNRERNWFQVNWRLAAAKLEHRFSPKTQASLMLFGLSAERNALGFRGNPYDLNANPVNDEDPVDETGAYIYPRDLIKGHFGNWGAEARFLTRYNMASRQQVFLIGSKVYLANNTSKQGPSDYRKDAHFRFDPANTDYPAQSSFRFPNKNLAVFGENIFSITDRFSITPGFRFESIRTQSEGTYSQVTYDLANNPIGISELTDNRTLDRAFVLLGLGASYQGEKKQEWYANVSQNYRSVTFSDIRVVNPSFIVDPNIADERGYTGDIGVRGRLQDVVNYDASVFGLLYNDRIGTVFDDRANRVRTNIGDAFIYGLELFMDVNLLAAFQSEATARRLNWFVNTAFTDSYYTQSQLANVQGKKVEFIPFLNVKSGINFGVQNFQGSLQMTYLSRQFTDAENSSIAESTDSRAGIIGHIPAYQIWDLSLAYTYKHLKMETGLNNLLNESYFTRRATGYPGPGIIPSDPRTVYLTLQLSY